MTQSRSRYGSCTFRPALLLVMLSLPAAADHPRDVRVALDGLRSRNMSAVDKVFLKDAAQSGTDRLLSLYELGSLYHLDGDFSKSIQFFNTADAVARDYEGQAVVSAGAAGRTTGALFTNDAVLKYEGPAYEKVMSRTLNAVNYVLTGSMEDARVELRKAEEYQRLERERHQREAARADHGQARGAESATLDNPAVASAYGKMFDYVKNVRNSFENAFTYYLASQVYQARGEDGLNDALVEIKRAYALAPQAPGVRSAYLEIARAQGGGAYDDARALLRVADPAPGPDSGAVGSVVVVYETGLVPQMEEVKINLFAANKLYGLAFPIYRSFEPARPPLAIMTPAQTFTTSCILDTRALAVKSLEERMPGILTRGLLGAIAKGEVQAKAEKDYGFFGGLVSKVASTLLTSADRRSWLSLPAEVQVAKCALPVGPNLLTLRGPDLMDKVALTVTPGSSTFLVVRSFRGFNRVDVKTFNAAGEESGPPGAGVPDTQPAASAAKL